MNHDLFLSILAMDSYNRGYGQRINVRLPSTGSIGAATITTDSLVELDQAGSSRTQAAGFFASAYTYNGETIISYRGTDGNTITDALNGYGVALGYADQPQGNLATEFYLTVTGKHVYDLAAPSNVVVVGHSLGGGLAGLVAARGKTDSYLVNPIPYGATAWGQAIGDALTATCNYVTASDFYALHKFLSISRKDRKDSTEVADGRTGSLLFFVCNILGYRTA